MQPVTDSSEQNPHLASSLHESQAPSVGQQSVYAVKLHASGVEHIEEARHQTHSPVDVQGQQEEYKEQFDGIEAIGDDIGGKGTDGGVAGASGA